MPKASPPVLSLILNVLNEEKNLERVYKECTVALKKAKIPYELLFVEGGSSDNSWKILQKLAKEDPNCKAVKAEFGPGQKIQAGIKVAKGKYIGFMCSDGQDDPAILPECIEALESSKADFVKGRRVNRSLKLKRKVLSWCYNEVTKRLFNLKLSDIDAHPKIFRRELVEGTELLSQKESIDLEMVIRAYYGRYKIYEVPVLERDRLKGRSSVNSSVMLNLAKDILSYRFGKKGRLLAKSIKKKNH